MTDSPSSSSSTDVKPKIGFVGLGEMGGELVLRLLKSGKYHVTGFNRTASKAERLVAEGMAWANSPADVAQDSEIIFTMLTNTEAVQSVVFTPGTGLLEGLVRSVAPAVDTAAPQFGDVEFASTKLLVDMSTISPTASEELARQVWERSGGRVAMLDSPVSGAQISVRTGVASFMVGGRARDFDRIRSVLLDLGAHATHVGANGKGAALKVAINLNLAIQMQGLSEGLVLAERAGVPRDLALDVFCHSAIASPMIKYRGPFITSPPEKPWFPCTMMQKDVKLALELGHSLNVPLPLVAQTSQTLAGCSAIGVGEQDMAAMYKAVVHAAGLIQ